MLYTCPKCNQPFDLDPKEVNETKSFTCPHCQAHFDFGAPAPKEEPHEEVPAPKEEPHDEPVSQNATVPPLSDGKLKLCPFCGEEIRAAALKCKHCGELLTPDNPLYAKLKIQPPTDASAPLQVVVPAPAPAPEPEVGPSVIPTPLPEAAPLPVEAPVFSPQPEEQPLTEEPKENNGKSGDGGWIALLLGVVALIVIILISTNGGCGGEKEAPTEEVAAEPYYEQGQLQYINGIPYEWDPWEKAWRECIDCAWEEGTVEPSAYDSHWIDGDEYYYDADSRAWRRLQEEVAAEEAPADEAIDSICY